MYQNCPHYCHNHEFYEICDYISPDYINEIDTVTSNLNIGDEPPSEIEETILLKRRKGVCFECVGQYSHYMTARCGNGEKVYSCINTSNTSLGDAASIASDYLCRNKLGVADGPCYRNTQPDFLNACSSFYGLSCDFADCNQAKINICQENRYQCIQNCVYSSDPGRCAHNCVNALTPCLDDACRICDENCRNICFRDERPGPARDRCINACGCSE